MKQTDFWTRWGAAVLVIVIISAIGYFISQRNRLTYTPSVSVSTSTSTSEQFSANISQWKVYTNQQFGYSLEYPNTWTAVVCLSGEQLVIYSPVENPEDCDVPLSNYDMSVIVPIPATSTQFENDDINSETIVINGISAKRYVHVAIGQDPSDPVFIDKILIPDGNNIFQIDILKDSTTTERIISTMRMRATY